MVAELKRGVGCAFGLGKAATVGATSKAPSFCRESVRSAAVSCPVDCAVGEALAATVTLGSSRSLTSRLLGGT
eukprot:11166808-Lingulodinium_polyedra.AAC.1